MNFFRPFLTWKNAMICEHDNLEQLLEFRTKIAQAGRYILHMLHVRGMRSHIGLRIATQRFFPCLHTLGIAFYRWSTCSRNGVQGPCCHEAPNVMSWACTWMSVAKLGRA